jgi:MFS family permease
VSGAPAGPFVLAAAFGLGATSLYFYSLGLIAPQLHKAFGWTLAQITVAPVIISAVNLLASSRVGALVDSVGARRVALPGYVAFCLALAALSFAGPHLWTWYVLWLLLALSFVFTAPSVWTSSIVGVFDKSRGLAISLALCALSVTTFLTPRIVVWASAQESWRFAVHRARPGYAGRGRADHLLRHASRTPRGDHACGRRRAGGGAPGR